MAERKRGVSVPGTDLTEGELPPEVMDPYVAMVRQQLTQLEASAYRILNR